MIMTVIIINNDNFPAKTMITIIKLVTLTVIIIITLLSLLLMLLSSMYSCRISIALLLLP